MVGDSPPEAARGVRQRFPEIYQDLLGVAAKMLGQSPPRTVTPSSLTHDAFVKLSSEEARRRAGNRSELGDKPDSVFKACFGAACRDLLVDRARRRAAERRGGKVLHEEISTSIPVEAGDPHDVLELHDALTALTALDPLLGQLAELRVFGDLTIAECAETLNLPTRTVDRKWAFARAWLHSRLR